MDKLLGTRLKRAREEVNLSQGAFAKSLGLSSEYISLLESGKRTPSFETLLKVAGFLNKNVSYFFEDRQAGLRQPVRPGCPRQPGRGRRAGPQGPPEVPGHLRKIPRARGSRPGRRLALAPQYARISPERLAEEERRRLGLGNEPIRDVLGLCEVNGCRIIRQTLSDEARIAGVFVYDEERKAAFALVNANEPPGLQTLIAAHLYGHYLMDRADSPIVDNPDVVVDEYVSLYPPREQFAQTFASRFLVPPDKLRELVEKDLRSKSLGFDDVLFLKRYFGVSTRALLRTLRGDGHPAGGEVRGVLQEESGGPGTGGLRGPVGTGRAALADPVPEVQDHSVRPLPAAGRRGRGHGEGPGGESASAAGLGRYR